MPVHKSKLGQVAGQAVATRYDKGPAGIYEKGLPGSALNIAQQFPAWHDPSTLGSIMSTGREIGTNIGQAIFGEPAPGPQTTGPPLPAPQPAGGTMALPPPPWQEAPNIPGVSVSGSSVPGVGYPNYPGPPSPPPYESTPFPGTPPMTQENIIPPDMGMPPPLDIQLDPNVVPLPTSPGLKDLKKMTRPLQGSIFSQPDKFPL